MKMGKNTGQVKLWLKESGQKIRMVERCGMQGEKVYHSADEIPEDASYYSLLIVGEQGQDDQ